MLDFFDYVYYKVCKFYAKESSSALSGVIVIGLLQTLNLGTIFFLISIFEERKIKVNKVVALLIYVLLVILNGIRYNRITYAILDERWKDEEEGKKIKKQLLVLLYVSISVVLSIGLAIYLGSKD